MWLDGRDAGAFDATTAGRASTSGRARLARGGADHTRAGPGSTVGADEIPRAEIPTEAHAAGVTFGRRGAAGAVHPAREREGAIGATCARLPGAALHTADRLDAREVALAVGVAAARLPSRPRHAGAGAGLAEDAASVRATEVVRARPAERDPSDERSVTAVQIERRRIALRDVKPIEARAGTRRIEARLAARDQRFEPRASLLASQRVAERLTERERADLRLAPHEPPAEVFEEVIEVRREPKRLAGVDRRGTGVDRVDRSVRRHAGVELERCVAGRGRAPACDEETETTREHETNEHDDSEARRGRGASEPRTTDGAPHDADRDACRHVRSDARNVLRDVARNETSSARRGARGRGTRPPHDARVSAREAA